MTRTAFAALAGALLAAACAPSPAQNDARIGEPEGRLLAQLGPPATTVQDGDARVLRYEFVQTATIPGDEPKVPWHAYAPWDPVTQVDSTVYPARTVTTGTCTTEYRVVGGVVQSWQHHGNAC
jgi:hypothetical protein